MMYATVAGLPSEEHVEVRLGKLRDALGWVFGQMPNAKAECVGVIHGPITLKRIRSIVIGRV
jgi:hypothetical protein